MFKWNAKIKAQNVIFLDKKDGGERPFKARFLQAGLVKYDFGVCLLKKETIDKFVDGFLGCPVIINHKDNIKDGDKVGEITKVWFNPEDGWFWCDGVLWNEKAINLIEKEGFNVSCQYEITEYIENLGDKLHNGNEYDKEILNGHFEHLAIVENPRYEGAKIAVNAYIAKNAICRNEFKEEDHPRDEDGKFTERQQEYFDKWSDAPEIELKSSEWDNISDINELRRKAKEYFINNLQGQTLTREELKNIRISGKSFDEFFHVSADPDKLKAVPQVPELIEKGKLGTFEPDYKGRTDYIKGFYPIYVNLKTPVKTRKAELLIGEDKEGNLFYQMFLDYDREAARKKRNTADNQDRLSLNNNIPHLDADLNPSAQNSLQNQYQKIINHIQNWKGKTMTLEERLFKGLFAALKAKNEADENEGKKDGKKDDVVDKRDIIRQIMAIAGKHEDNEDVRTIAKLAEKLAYDKSEAGTADNETDDDKKEDKEKDDKKASNEEVDKRKLIDEIGGILKGKVDEEIWRTIIKKVEEASYNKSEAGTADNCKGKNKAAKNEDDEAKYDDFKKEVEEEAANKAKNALDKVAEQIYSAVVPKEKMYISQKEGLELGHQVWGK